MISSLDAILQAEKDWIEGIGGIGGWVLQWFAYISFEGRSCKVHFRWGFPQGTFGWLDARVRCAGLNIGNFAGPQCH